MTRQNFIEVVDARLKNFKDNYGNYKIVGKEKTYRIKPQNVSFRLEVLGSNKEWHNLKWGEPQYYKNVNEEKLISLCNKLISVSVK